MKLEVEGAGDRIVPVGRDLAEAQLAIQRDGGLHEGGNRVEADGTVAEGAGVGQRGIGEDAAQAAAAEGGPDVEALHLGDLRVPLMQPDAPGRPHQVGAAHPGRGNERALRARGDLQQRDGEEHPGEEQHADQHHREPAADALRREDDGGVQRQRDHDAHREERGHSRRFLNSVFSTPGLPLPFKSFIAWPTKKPSRVFLPDLYFSTSAELRAITASTTASSADSSDTCERPFSCTICTGGFPVRRTSASTSLAAVEESVPASCSRKTSAICAGWKRGAERSSAPSLASLPTSPVTTVAARLAA